MLEGLNTAQSLDLSRFLRSCDIDRLDLRDPAWIAEIYRVFHGPMERYFRSEVRGLDRIPPGPALYVGNHNALAMTPDSFLFGIAVYRERGLEDLPFGLGHEHVIRLPIVNAIVVPLGVVRACHSHARALLARGHKVLVHPGSEHDAMRPWRDRNRIRFEGRTGYIRLALEAGVPVSPVVASGASLHFLPHVAVSCV